MSTAEDLLHEKHPGALNDLFNFVHELESQLSGKIGVDGWFLAHDKKKLQEEIARSPERRLRQGLEDLEKLVDGLWLVC